MARTRAQAGRSNRRTGLAWQKHCAAWLRVNGFPHAQMEIEGKPGDLAGTWDVNAECTVEPWERVLAKLEQSERAAAVRGLELWCVWKRRRGKASPGEGFIIMPARVFWPRIVARLEELERFEYDAAAEYERGYRDGVAGRAAEEARA